MREHLLHALRTTFILLVVTCGLYPATVWAIGQLAFRDQANGSLIVRDGRVIGSSLIAQRFTSDRYFHPRPSAVKYDAAASGGSNLGPTSKKLRAVILSREDGEGPPALSPRDPSRSAALRMTDMLTASGSGLDPHIPPESAYAQAARVAHARGLAEARVRMLVAQRVEGRFLGLYGELRVNVLLHNLDLDEAPRPR
jgi:K+-transporting ATPase ATPase C chain